jgi:hypothetical protein
MNWEESLGAGFDGGGAGATGAGCGCADVGCGSLTGAEAGCTTGCDAVVVSAGLAR